MIKPDSNIWVRTWQLPALVPSSNKGGYVLLGCAWPTGCRSRARDSTTEGGGLTHLLENLTSPTKLSQTGSMPTNLGLSSDERAPTTGERRQAKAPG